MSSDIALLIERIADAMMRQDDAAVAMFFTEDALLIVPGRRFVGAQAIYDGRHSLNQAVTNIRIVIKRVIACGNEGVVEWSCSETRRSDQPELVDL